MSALSVVPGAALAQPQPLPRNPPPLAADLQSFQSRSWPEVHGAKHRLESRQAEVLPALVELAFNQQRAPLQNTADLIYPGARAFYEHGLIIDYDLDNIAARAGWLLEDLTFENFGFASGATSAHDTHAAAEAARRWWLAASRPWRRFQALRVALASGDPRRHLLALSWLRRPGRTACDGLSNETYARDILSLVTALASKGASEVRLQATELLRTGLMWW